MSGATRFAVVLIGMVCVVWAVYNAVTPDRYTIQMFAVQSDGVRARLVVNVPASSMPVRTGDELDVGATTIGDRIQYFSQAIPGSSVNVPLIRSGQRVNVAVVVPPGLVPPPRWIDLILTILEVAFGLAVMVRAGNHPLGRMVVWLAIVELGGTVCADFGYTAPTPGLAFYAGELPTGFFEAATSFIAVWAATFLPGGARLRTPAFAVALAVAALLTAENLAPVVQVFYPLLSSALSNGTYIAAILVSLAMAVVLITIAQAAPSDQRMRSMWFVSTLIGWFIGSALGVLLNLGFGGAAWLFWTSYLLQSFTLLGPIYATLRHRLLDLNFVVTRSAIYAILSVLMLGSFAGAEWVAGKVADAVLEGAFWKGIAAQLLSFAAAILIGLYLRSVHSRLEGWVNGVLFRDRIRKLNLLESFARESDLVQTRSELLNVTYEALRESIDADEFAVYVAADGALTRAHGRSAPERLERDDRVVLQLLERQCSFVSEVSSLRDWLLIPLAVRRDIVGAIACAPKRDRTAYLPDEQRVLNDVARRVATSYALLLPAFGATPATELRR